MQGFTLVELITVLVLAAILAFSVIPRWPGRAIELSGQTEQLANDIRLVQSMSMTRGQSHCLMITSPTYQIRNNNCTTAVAHPATGSTNPITLTNVTLAPSPVSIQFNGRGQPGAATTITLSSSGESRTVTVSAETGRVTP